MAPCAGRPAGNGRAPVKQKVRPALPSKNATLNPGMERGRRRARGRTPGTAAENCGGGSAPAAKIDSVVQYSLHQQYPKIRVQHLAIFRISIDFDGRGGAHRSGEGRAPLITHAGLGLRKSKLCPAGAVKKHDLEPNTEPTTRPEASAMACSPRHGFTAGCRSYVTVTSQLRHSYVTVTSQLRHEETYLILRIL